MNICLAGWYFHKPLLETLKNSKYDTFTVSHKSGCGDKAIANIGLEFGCYDWYIKNEWKGGSVLFFHDDNEITEGALDEIAKLTPDQCFLFSSEQEAKANGCAHGRAFFCSERFLQRLKTDGGFWYDEGNHGNVGPTTSDGPNYHNLGIQTFRAYLSSLPKEEFRVNRYVFVPGMRLAYRGRI